MREATGEGLGACSAAPLIRLLAATFSLGEVARCHNPVRRDTAQDADGQRDPIRRAVPAPRGGPSLDDDPRRRLAGATGTPAPPPSPRTPRASRSCARSAASRTTSRRRSPPPSGRPIRATRSSSASPPSATRSSRSSGVSSRRIRDVPAKLLVGDDRISINPKLNNLVKGWEAASHDWIVMADSNVLMPPDYIERLLAHWGPRTGIVSSPPVGAAPDGIWAELECGFLNTYQARWQLAADAFGLGFAHGKTMLWRRDILEGAGGIRALAAKPAEDAAGTQLVRDRGLRGEPRAAPLPAAARETPLHRSLAPAASLGAAATGVVRPLLLSGDFFRRVLAALHRGSSRRGRSDPARARAALRRCSGTAPRRCSRQRSAGRFHARSLALWIARDLMLPVALARRHLRQRLRLARQRNARAPRPPRRAGASARGGIERRGVGLPASPNTSAISS